MVKTEVNDNSDRVIIVIEVQHHEISSEEGIVVQTQQSFAPPSNRGLGSARSYASFVPHIRRRLHVVEYVRLGANLADYEYQSRTSVEAKV